MRKKTGVIISDTLKPAAQCAKAAKTANSVLGQMSRSFHFRDKHVWIRFQKTFVRPHLELCVQAWCPWYENDCEVLERVQKRAVDMVVGLKATGYHDKLKELNLPSLRERRSRGDMIQIWKYQHGVSLGGSNILQTTSADHTRRTRHTKKPLNISWDNARLEIRKNFFVSRCVDSWNSLPERVQNAESLNDFKREYDKIHKTRAK